MSIPYNRHSAYHSSSSLESLSTLGFSLPDSLAATATATTTENDSNNENHSSAPLSLASIRHSLDTLHEIIPNSDTDVDMEVMPMMMADPGVPEIDMEDAPPPSLTGLRNRAQTQEEPLVEEYQLRRSKQPVMVAREQNQETQVPDHSSTAQSTASLLFSPTLAGAHLALYQHPPEPSLSPALDNLSINETFTSTSTFDQKHHQQQPQQNQQNQHQHAVAYPPQDQSPALPTPTPAWIAAMAAHLDRHHALQRAALTPYVVSSYLQLFANAAIVVFAGIALAGAGRALRRDVLSKMASKRAALLSAAQRCAVEYVRNECRPDVRVPALDDACRAWEHCMDQALPFLGTSQETPSEVSGILLNNGKLMMIEEENAGDMAYFPALAETLADIANAFFEPVTLKSLAAIILMVIATVYVINFGFGYLRAVTFYERDSRRGRRSSASGVDPQGAAAIAAAYYELQQKQIKN
ncbi:uncharacterized protein SAPINGB_P001542 [Magnusiomyces paraingens]|uniref:Brl1/Brr6 domain-containing protein n=1 Tax=Magnusiomyces paraingens TaxID=2606893 RepID=A0A5E8B6A2_9ASCO|nr:uncharacterized protein SAPINGB_P001542 [Saprochaete ingens]VVT47099.1 unnamed protein product [Saprochaete ingens]